MRLLRPQHASDGTAASAEVSALAISPAGVGPAGAAPRQTVAAGYSNGAVRVFALATGALSVTFHGHRAAVGAVRFDRGGLMLATGGRNGDLVVWDVGAERGLYRLRSHREAITDVAFVSRVLGAASADGAPLCGAARALVSSSRDGLVKVWDLETQHCVQTLSGHRCEVCALDVNEAGTRLATGAADRLLRVWALDLDKLDSATAPAATADGDRGGEPALPDFEVAAPMGSVQREGSEKCQGVRFHSAGGEALLGCHAAKSVELFRVRDDEHARRRLKRRLRRRREKRARLHAEPAEADADEALAAADELEALGVLRSAHKIRAFSFCAPGARADAETARVVLALHSNALELHALSCAGGARADAADDAADGAAADAAAAPAAQVRRVSAIEMAGHRSGVRAVALSADDALVASASSSSLKVWSARSRACVRSVACGYATCVAFLPGDRHVVVGTREGALTLFELASIDPVAEIADAHAGALWALDVHPDGRTVATGGADNDVKFWAVQAGAGGAPLAEGADDARGAASAALELAHARTLRMADDVLAVRYSRARSGAARGEAAARQLLAVATLDATVKVFFADTLKFSLSLYGHKLPVLCVDTTDDGALIATGSADKTLKLWGLDFGDCHRSLLAHDDSVTAVRFVPQTHYVFTASKDKTVKYWDADRFEQVREPRDSPPPPPAARADASRARDAPPLSKIRASRRRSCGSRRTPPRSGRWRSRATAASWSAAVTTAPFGCGNARTSRCSSMRSASASSRPRSTPSSTRATRAGAISRTTRRSASTRWRPTRARRSRAVARSKASKRPSA